jgi:hypothetical protein
MSPGAPGTGRTVIFITSKFTDVSVRYLCESLLIAGGFKRLVHIVQSSEKYRLSDMFV